MTAYRALGVAYYPEHWDESLWEDDVVRMLEHGLDTLRIAEFAWGLLEPTEGVFDFSLFDRFLQVCERHGIKVIFGTPTATPPAWMQRDYPEILNRDRMGHPFDGPRRNYNYNSPTYKFFTERIVRELADHYGQHPSIVGWQIDNELNCEVAEFFSEADHTAFREYLRAKYKDLDTVNQALGNTFWSHTYSDWSQVRLGEMGLYGSHNPHLELEEKRFFSKSVVDYLKLQVDVLRPRITEGSFITTNGLFPNVDYDQMMDAGLDFITFDSYPNFARDLDRSGVEAASAGDLRDRKWSWNLAWTRAISPTFGIMEQQSGPHGWTNRMMGPAPKPGQMRLWTMQSVSHGADMVCYFRWRTSPMGNEIYWHGLNDYANTPNRRLRELQGVSAEWQKLAPVAGAVYQAKVAVLKDYDNEFDAALDNWHGRVARASDDAWFTTTQLTHTPCDFLFLGAATAEQLAEYELLVYPHAAIMTEEHDQKLRSYVEGGGTLVFGARTGYKDDSGRCPMRVMPGIVSEWTGVQVEEYTFLAEDSKDMTATWGNKEIPAPVFNETLVPTGSDTEVLARFAKDYYKGDVALTRRQVGAGTVYYLGSCFSGEMVRAILAETGQLSPLTGTVEAPETVELAVRASEDGQWLFALNYMAEPAEVTFTEQVTDILSEETVSGAVTLEPYGVGVYKL